MENLHVISTSNTVTCRQIPKSFTLTNSCWCLSNNGFFYCCFTVTAFPLTKSSVTKEPPGEIPSINYSERIYDHRSGNCNFSNCKLIPALEFMASPLALPTVSYENPYIKSSLIYWAYLVNEPAKWVKQRIKIIQNVEILTEMKIWPSTWKAIAN